MCHPYSSEYKWRLQTVREKTSLLGSKKDILQLCITVPALDEDIILTTADEASIYSIDQRLWHFKHNIDEDVPATPPRNRSASTMTSPERSFQAIDSKSKSIVRVESNSSVDYQERTSFTSIGRPRSGSDNRRDASSVLSSSSIDRPAAPVQSPATSRPGSPSIRHPSFSLELIRQRLLALRQDSAPQSPQSDVKESIPEVFCSCPPIPVSVFS